MSFDQIREHCLRKAGVTEEFPFGPDTLVMKVFGKVFLLTNVDNPVSINVKCDPELAVELRERYETVLPGYHMNKKHWNTVLLRGAYSRAELISWIDQSYDLVFNSLPNKTKETIRKG